MTMQELAAGVRDALWFLLCRILDGVAMGFIIACLIGGSGSFFGVWVITGTMFALFGRYWR